LDLWSTNNKVYLNDSFWTILKDITFFYLHLTWKKKKIKEVVGAV